MPASLLVADGSVLLEWVLPADDGPDADQALLLREAILNEAVQGLVPASWLYEIGNTVARRFPSHAMSWLPALIKFGLMESMPSQRWLAKVLELTRRYEVSFCEAAYHAVALVHGGVFVTADAQCVHRAREAGSVISLRDWQPPRTLPPDAAR